MNNKIKKFVTAKNLDKHTIYENKFFMIDKIKKNSISKENPLPSIIQNEKNNSELKSLLLPSTLLQTFDNNKQFTNS